MRRWKRSPPCLADAASKINLTALDTPEETALLKEPAHQTRLATAITAGLIFQIGVRR